MLNKKGASKKKKKLLAKKKLLHLSFEVLNITKGKKEKNVLVFEDLFWPLFSLVVLINFVFIKQKECNGYTKIQKFNIILNANIFLLKT